MQLVSDDGAFIELVVAGYQFPSVPGISSQGDGADWDANWLVVRGSVHMAAGHSWAFSRPCLTTWEAADFLAFLQRVAAGNAWVVADRATSRRRLEFVQPELAVEEVDIESDPRTIEVHLSHGSAPRVSPQQSAAHGVTVRICMNSQSWQSAVDTWATELAAHPQR